jgi:hypothetical protein
MRLEDAIDVIDGLLRLEADWDSYGALPIRFEAASRAVALLIQAAEREVSQPAIVPTNRGGLQLEWHYSDYDLEVQVGPDGTWVELLEATPAEATDARIEDDPELFEAALVRLERQRTA